MLCDPRGISATPIGLGFFGLLMSIVMKPDLPTIRHESGPPVAVGCGHDRLQVVRDLDVALAHGARQVSDLFRLLGVVDVDDVEPAAVLAGHLRCERVVVTLDGRELHVGAAVLADVRDDLQALALTLERGVLLTRRRR